MHCFGNSRHSHQPRSLKISEPQSVPSTPSNHGVLRCTAPLHTDFLSHFSPAPYLRQTNNSAGSSSGSEIFTTPEKHISVSCSTSPTSVSREVMSSPILKMTSDFEHHMIFSTDVNNSPKNDEKTNKINSSHILFDESTEIYVNSISNATDMSVHVLDSNFRLENPEKMDAKFHGSRDVKGNELGTNSFNEFSILEDCEGETENVTEEVDICPVNNLIRSNEIKSSPSILNTSPNFNHINKKAEKNCSSSSVKDYQNDKAPQIYFVRDIAKSEAAGHILPNANSLRDVVEASDSSNKQCPNTRFQIHGQKNTSCNNGRDLPPRTDEINTPNLKSNCMSKSPLLTLSAAGLSTKLLSESSSAFASSSSFDSIPCDKYSKHLLTSNSFDEEALTANRSLGKLYSSQSTFEASSSASQSTCTIGSLTSSNIKETLTRKLPPVYGLSDGSDGVGIPVESSAIQHKKLRISSSSESDDDGWLLLNEIKKVSFF